MLEGFLSHEKIHLAKKKVMTMKGKVRLTAALATERLIGALFEKTHSKDNRLSPAEEDRPGNDTKLFVRLLHDRPEPIHLIILSLCIFPCLSTLLFAYIRNLGDV